MSELHKALSSLSPRDFSDVPTSDLATYLRSTFKDAHLIADTVPLPPGGDPSIHTPSVDTPNCATKASEIVSSPVRPPPPGPDIEKLQDAWGKPLKIAASSNPVDVTVWKMAGHDRHGAWFARRSVHEGLGFHKWKKAMMREFPESLAVEGRPGEGSVRGIGADRRLEKQVVDGVGKLEVYQAAAQFPRPTAPREFIPMILSTDADLSESTHEPPPRHYTVVSIPVTHPDAPPRDGLVRGQYESVEMIREIPLKPAKSKSVSMTNLLDSSPKRSKDNSATRHRGHTIGFAESRGTSAKGERMDRDEEAADEAELNPVEWIMITRSDPGGGIPRFMVERGTPGSITADAGKFLDWACSNDEFPSDDEVEPEPEPEPELEELATALAESTSATVLSKSDDDSTLADSKSQEGIISGIRKTIETGIETYAPAVIQNNLPEIIVPTKYDRDSESDTTETSSLSSFASAAQFNTAEEGPEINVLPTSSTASLQQLDSSASPALSENSSKLTMASGASPQPKELARLAKKKEELETKLAKSKEKDQKEKEKAETKYQRDLAKLEARRDKELQKLDEKRRKQAAKDTMGQLQRERDEWRLHAEVVKKENEILKLQVGELQRENTMLVQRLGKTEDGKLALRNFREEFSRSRSLSMRSIKSERSNKS